MKFSRAWCIFFLFFLPVPIAQAEQIMIWVRAFIPNSGAAAIIPRPNHPGESMVEGPPGTNCFLTDQRGFSSDKKESARLSSVLSFSLTKDGYSALKHVPETGVTHEVKCGNGDATGLCAKQAPASEIIVSKQVFEKAGSFFFVDLDGKASNPCIEFLGRKSAPKIHWKLKFSFNAANRLWGVTAEVGDFPSFEAYMQVDNKPPVTIFQSSANAFNWGIGIATSRPMIEKTGTY